MVMISTDPCILTIHVCSQFLIFCVFFFVIFFSFISVMKAVFNAMEEKKTTVTSFTVEKV